MKKVIALNKNTFDNNFTSENIKSYDYACFISILDMDNEEKKYDLSNDNFLQVKMWDIEKDVIDNNGDIYEKPSDIELKKIVDFINKHKDKYAFIVHCSAGISRSGAVVKYINDIYNEEIDSIEFFNDNQFIQPNIYILKRLHELNTL